MSLILSLFIGLAGQNSFACRILTTDQPTSAGCGDSQCDVQTCLSGSGGGGQGFLGSQSFAIRPVRLPLVEHIEDLAAVVTSDNSYSTAYEQRPDTLEYSMTRDSSFRDRPRFSLSGEQP